MGLYISSIIACTLTLTLSSSLVAIQAAVSGVLVVPFTTFLLTLLAVHLVIGLIEGAITAAVLVYIKQVRPDVIEGSDTETAKVSTAVFCVTIMLATVIVGCWISLYASGNPDGLEWSYAERPDQPEFTSSISNDSATIAKVDELHSRMSLMPDYTRRPGDLASVPSSAWQSLAAVVGSIATMAVIYLLAQIARRKNGCHAPCPD